jgi:glycosyltransferase involved in cell wall biosynthesis
VSSRARAAVLQLISSSGLFGAERVLLELSSFLAAEGHPTTVGVLTVPEAPAPAVATEARRRGLRVLHLPCRRKFDAAAAWRLRRFVEEEGIGVVHSHGYKSDLYQFLAALPATTARVATCHNWLTDSLKLLVYELLDKLVMHRLDHVVAVSERLRGEIVAAGIAPGRVSVVENGLDLPAPSPGARARIRGELGLEAEDRLLVTVGRLDPWKDHATLLEALARLVATEGAGAARAGAPRLLLVGDGELRGVLERRAAELGLGRRVIFAGYRSEIAESLAAGDLFVLSSKKEGLPMVLLEAMAAEKPIVSTSVGEIPRALGDGAAGVLVPPRDPGALAAALGSLLRDGERADALARRARARYSEMYSRRAMGERYLALYDRLLSTRSPSPRARGGAA